MPHRTTVTGYLGRAETQIAECEFRVARLIVRVERLRLAGQDSQRSERLLRHLEESLTAWRASRAQFLVSIAQLEGGNRL